MAGQLGELLQKRGLRMGTAESCTGGRIAGLITAYPGCSAYYVGSIVSYSNEVKMNLLGVSPVDLDLYGAVSRPVVEQMVRGAMDALGCDCVVATSGIAGPGGGTPEKPVGTVWIAAGIGSNIVSRCYHLGTGREDNIRKASAAALQMLWELLI